MKEQLLCSGESGASDAASSSSSSSCGACRLFSSPQALLKHLLEEQHRE
jgi:hypothetical protein